ncbi:MAG: hypothetical protein RIS70_1355 [Planctomycetota bacterium]
MSFLVDNDARERVRQATDIADLINAFVPLRRQGRNLTGLCWMHEDSRPSLHINPQRQTWRCFVCNVGGDVFSFVQQYHKVGFREALEMLADRAGIPLPKQPGQREVKPGGPEDKKTLLQAMEWAQRQFHECLLHSSEAEGARKYLVERQISDESVRRFGLGYSPNSWQWLIDRARSTSFSTEVLEACNLAQRKEGTQHYYDFFRGRLMFPIQDIQGRPIAFGGRVLPGGPEFGGKYVNSRETRLFVKSDNLYALHLAADEIRRTKGVVVMEGYTDVIIAHQSGIKNAVAVLGTALNSNHVRLMRRFADTAYLVLDGDEAGQVRTNAVLEHFLAENVDLRVVTLPDELDPAEFLLARTGDEFRQRLTEAVDAIEHRIRTATAGIDVVRDTHRANLALEQILETLAKSSAVRDGLPSAMVLREQQLLVRLARQFGVPEEAVRQRLRDLRQSNRATASRFSSLASPPAVASSGPGADFRGMRGAGSSVDANAPEVIAGDEPDSTKESWDAETARSLTARESELLEIMILHPELVSMATANIETDELESRRAQIIFDCYVSLVAEGEPTTLERVLAELRDPHMQGTLVELDDRAQAKSEHALQTAEDRLRALLNDFRGSVDARVRREMISELGKTVADPQKEMELLKNLLEDEKRRRGLTTATDR